MSGNIIIKTKTTSSQKHHNKIQKNHNTNIKMTRRRSHYNTYFASFFCMFSFFKRDIFDVGETRSKA
jgi:hypothetical protein